MAAPRKTTKLKSQGNNGYGLSYALSSLRAHPFRAISLALTLSLGISLFASTMVWGDTGVYVSIYEHLQQNTYQLNFNANPSDPQSLDLAGVYMSHEPLVESTYRMNSTVGIISGYNANGTYVNKTFPDSKQYDINGFVYTQHIKDTRVIFVDNDFLNNSARDFFVQGSFELHPGEVLVSRYFITLAEHVFDFYFKINDTIDIDVLTGAVVAQPASLGSLGRVRVTSMKIVGIYDPTTTDSLIERALPSMKRANWIQADNMYYPVLGLRDSVMMLNNEIAPHSVSENSFFPQSILVRLSARGIANEGPSKLVPNIFSFVFRTQELYNLTWDGADQIWGIYNAVQTYIATLSLSILALPVILLALFFSVFAADAFMAPRTVEIGVIRSKGATYSQVSSIFLWETLIISGLAILMGIIFSIFFAPLIPASISFMSFDWSVYIYYLEKTVLTSSTILRAIGLTVLPSMLFILYRARKAAQTEIGLTLMEATEDPTEQYESHGFTIGASIFLFIIVLILMAILPKGPTFFLMELSMGTAAWFFLAYNGSKLSRVGLARISKKLSFVLGQKNLISAGYLRMRKGRIIPLMVVLALTMSTTIAFAVQSQSFQVDLKREVTYAVGADLRIDATPKFFNYSNTLAAVNGVEQISPVLSTWARVASTDITVEALNASSYAMIGKFDQSSFPNQDPATVLGDLAAVQNGIIISDFLASFLNKTAGDNIVLEMSDIGTTQLVTFVVVGTVHTAPGFGYASTNDIPPSALGPGFGLQAGYSGFVLTNLGFVANTIHAETTTLFLANLAEGTNHTQLFYNLWSLPGVYPTTPQDFNLKSRSLQTALFLNTVEGLFSIGFVMSLVLSIFALSISLGSVVRERRKEYAIMRAIGGSQRQIVGMVFSEFAGVVMASLLLSVILGAAFGYVMGYILNGMLPFSRMLSASLDFPLEFLSIVLLIEILTMVVGAYLPAREASRTEPAVVLRNM